MRAWRSSPMVWKGTWPFHPVCGLGDQVWSGTFFVFFSDMKNKPLVDMHWSSKLLSMRSQQHFFGNPNQPSWVLCEKNPQVFIVSKGERHFQRQRGVPDSQGWNVNLWEPPRDLDLTGRMRPCWILTMKTMKRSWKRGWTCPDEVYGLS